MTQIINLKKDQQIDLSKDGVALTKGVFGLVGNLLHLVTTLILMLVV